MTLMVACGYCQKMKPADGFKTCEPCRQRKRAERMRAKERERAGDQTHAPLHLVPRSPEAFMADRVIRRDYTPRPAPEVEYHGQKFWVVYNGS
jgi:hypothetical protein